MQPTAPRVRFFRAYRVLETIGKFLPRPSERHHLLCFTKGIVANISSVLWSIPDGSADLLDGDLARLGI